VLAHHQTVELPDPNERAVLSTDPLATLERTTVAAQRAAEGRAGLVVLAADREAKWGGGSNGYALNRRLRDTMRQHKQADARLDAEWVSVCVCGGGGGLTLGACRRGHVCCTCCLPSVPTAQHC
jgi:hypothetical protein